MRSRCHQVPEVDVGVTATRGVVQVGQTEVVTVLVSEDTDPGVLGLVGMATYVDMSGTMFQVSYFYLLGVKGYWVAFEGSLALFLSFLMIFMAELGDKTQLTAMALATRYPWKKIFIGIAVAFALLNVGAVLVVESHREPPGATFVGWRPGTRQRARAGGRHNRARRPRLPRCGTKSTGSTPRGFAWSLPSGAAAT